MRKPQFVRVAFLFGWDEIFAGFTPRQVGKHADRLAT
jgi:hypothetical protein